MKVIFAIAVTVLSLSVTAFAVDTTRDQPMQVATAAVAGHG